MHRLAQAVAVREADEGDHPHPEGDHPNPCVLDAETGVVFRL